MTKQLTGSSRRMAMTASRPPNIIKGMTNDNYRWQSSVSNKGMISGTTNDNSR